MKQELGVKSFGSFISYLSIFSIMEFYEVKPLSIGVCEGHTFSSLVHWKPSCQGWEIITSGGWPTPQCISLEVEHTYHPYSCEQLRNILYYLWSRIEPYMSNHWAWDTIPVTVDPYEWREVWVNIAINRVGCVPNLGCQNCRWIGHTSGHQIWAHYIKVNFLAK